MRVSALTSSPLRRLCLCPVCDHAVKAETFFPFRSSCPVLSFSQQNYLNSSSTSLHNLACPSFQTAFYTFTSLYDLSLRERDFASPPPPFSLPPSNQPTNHTYKIKWSKKISAQNYAGFFLYTHMYALQHIFPARWSYNELVVKRAYIYYFMYICTGVMSTHTTLYIP